MWARASTGMILIPNSRNIPSPVSEELNHVWLCVCHEATLKDTPHCWSISPPFVRKIHHHLCLYFGWVDGLFVCLYLCVCVWGGGGGGGDFGFWFVLNFLMPFKQHCPYYWAAFHWQCGDRMTAAGASVVSMKDTGKIWIILSMSNRNKLRYPSSYL